ncbi:MAG: PilZ domain-containing protein [Myxococcota bacterium]
MNRRPTPRAERVRRCYRVNFGTEAPTLRGMTSDISASGLLLISQIMLPLRTHIVMHVETGDATKVVEGEVARHHHVPRELRSLQRQGMGIRVTRNDDTPAIVAHSQGFRITCFSPTALSSLIARHVQGTFLMLPCEREGPAVRTRVEIAFTLPFRPATESPRLTGTVLQEMVSDVRNVVVEVDGVPDVAAVLRAGASVRQQARSPLPGM